MAAPSARMRLTVEVLPLHLDRSYGPIPEAHQEVLKGRKFALPVQLEHTFEEVWSQLEERYKRNYLTPAQAARFTIKKLQDAYDCDLDLSDTVSSIFEGETDPQKRMIKVVPSIINRDFSVPLESNLRPEHIRKRPREVEQEGRVKRRRIDGDEGSGSTPHSQPYNRPVPSTEINHNNSDNPAYAASYSTRPNSNARRSESRNSVFYVNDIQTGQQEFGTIKEESPELGATSVRTIPESEPEKSVSPEERFKKPTLPSPTAFFQRQQSRTRLSLSPQVHADEAHPEIQEEEHRDSTQEAQEAEGRSGLAQHGVGDVMDIDGGDSVVSLEADHETIHGQRTSTPSTHQNPNGVDATVNDEILDSPDPVLRSTKSIKTYGRQLRTPKAKNQALRPDSVATSSLRSTQGNERGSADSHQSRNSRARSFRSAKPDEIVSTPAEGGAPHGDSTRGAAELLKIVRNSRQNQGSREEGDARSPRMQKQPEQTASESNKTPQSTKGGLKRPSQKTFVLSKPTQSPLPSSSKATRNLTPKKTLPGASRRRPSASSIPHQSPPHDEHARIEELKRMLFVKAGTPARNVHQSTQSDKPGRRVATPTPPQTLPVPPIKDAPNKSSKAKEPASPTTSREDTLRKKSPVEHMEVVNGHETTAVIAKPSVLRRTPRQTPVPPPQSKISGDRGIRPPGTTKGNSATSKQAKQASQQASNVIPSVKPESMEPPRPPSVTDVGGTTTRRTPIPLPDNVRHLTKVSLNNKSRESSNLPSESKDTPSSATTSLPDLLKRSASKHTSARSQVPLPNNVRSSKPNTSTQPLPNGNTPKTTQLEKEVRIPGVRQTRSQAKTAEPVASQIPTNITEHIVLSSNVSSTSYSSDESEEDNRPKASSTQNEKSLGTTQDVGISEPNVSAKEQGVDLKRDKEGDGRLETRAVPNAAPASQKSVVQPQREAAPGAAASWGFEAIDREGKNNERKIPEKQSKVDLYHSEEDSESEADEKANGGSKSRSNSIANSNRSSPIISRGAARFLSHTPASEQSDSEVSASPTPPPAEKPVDRGASDQNEKDDSSSSDDSDDSDTESEGASNAETEDEQQDPKILDANSASPPPSSPPALAAAPPQLYKPNMMPPSTGPPAARKSKVAVPTTPSLSQPTPAARPTYTKYPSLQQQLNSAKTSTPVALKSKAVDPRLLNLGKLSKQKKAGKKVVALDSSSSSEDSSSDSESSESEKEVVPKGKKSVGRARA